MVLERWDKVIDSEMGAYFPDKDNFEVLNFPEKLSPLTNFSLDIFANVISKKNLIINFFDFKLHSVSLFAYIFSEKFNKNIYILADERGDSLNSRSGFSINKNHYLLCDYDAYIFRRLPIFYLEKDNEENESSLNDSINYKLTLKKYLPRAKISFKRGYTEENVLNDNYPKIIIDKDKNLFNIKEKLNSYLKDKDQHINSEEYPLGLIIIENADRFFYSIEKIKNFISWINEINIDVKLLIHFNNPHIEYIKIFINDLNCVVLPFNRYILENNNFLKNASEEYFSKIEKSELELLNRYNLDSKSIITTEPNICIYENFIPVGSIDSFFYSAYSSYRKIDKKSVFNNNYLYRARDLLFDLYNLTINPSYLKIPFEVNNKWIYGDVVQFIDIFRSRLHKENYNNEFLIYNFLDSLNNMYNELTKCKRVNEELSYAREGKDYVLLNLLVDLYKKEEKVFVGTYRDTEPEILKELLKKGYGIDDDIIVPINIRMLIQKQDNEKEDKILVLPGVIPERFTSELLKPYKKIIILVYEGNNHKLLKEQLNRVLHGDIVEEKEYMDYLKSTLETFDNAENNSILNDFNERFSLIEFEKEPEEKSTENVEDRVYEEVGDKLFHLDLHLRDYQKEQNIHKPKIDMEFSDKINEMHYDTITFKLQNINTEEFVEKRLPVNKSYLTFDNIYHIDEARELKTSELNSGDYIIIIDNDEKKSLLNLVMDISDFESEINMNMVEYWKLEFLNYIELNNLKYKEIYDSYCKKGGKKTYQTVLKWCKGETIGPQSSQDLYILGSILGNELIINNYESIFQQISFVRTFHRLIGRKLKKMIKSVLTDEYLDVSKSTDNEYLIYENIRNGIYKII